VEKEAKYKGYYLHAAAWGMPDSKSIDNLSQPKATNGNAESKEPNNINNDRPSRKVDPGKAYK
jgi:hypothetical protein